MESVAGSIEAEDEAPGIFGMSGHNGRKDGKVQITLCQRWLASHFINATNLASGATATIVTDKCSASNGQWAFILVDTLGKFNSDELYLMTTDKMLIPDQWSWDWSLESHGAREQEASAHLIESRTRKGWNTGTWLQ